VRSRFGALFIAIAAAAVGLSMLSATAAVAPLLHIDVVAVNNRGIPIEDLKPGEFELWINGYQIPIETVTFVGPSKPERPRTIVIVLDDVAVNPTMMPRVREAARRFVNRLSPGDRMAVVSLDGSTMKSTDDRALLLKAIEDYRVLAFPTRLEDLFAHVLDTVTTLSRQLSEASEGRKAIVAIGAAWLFDTPIQPQTISRDLKPEWVQAMRATASAHVSLYVIDPGGVGMRPANTGSSGFARETGGHAFLNTNDINGAVDRILRELDTYYVLSAQDPPVGRKADLREVEVKVLRRGVTARARRGIPPGA
jgi:VWFA-related protein